MQSNRRLPSSLRDWAYSVLDKNPVVEQGAIVENKHLGAALVATRLLQVERDEKRLSSKALTLREKESIAKTLETALDLSELPGGEHKERLSPVLESMRKALAESDAKRRERNRRTQEQFRARRAAALELSANQAPEQTGPEPRTAGGSEVLDLRRQ